MEISLNTILSLFTLLTAIVTVVTCWVSAKNKIEVNCKMIEKIEKAMCYKYEKTEVHIEKLEKELLDKIEKLSAQTRETNKDLYNRLNSGKRK